MIKHIKLFYIQFIHKEKYGSIYINNFAIIGAITVIYILGLGGLLRLFFISIGLGILILVALVIIKKISDYDFSFPWAGFIIALITGGIIYNTAIEKGNKNE